MTDISQHYLGYIIDLEAFSMLFRPRESDTEVIQFERFDYTPGNAEQIYRTITQCAQTNDPAWSLTASLVFIYLLRTDQLMVMEMTDGIEHWFVKDNNTGEVFDFDDRSTEGPNKAGQETARPVNADRVTSMPSDASFDLLERLQSSARRYPVDERITLANHESSDFMAKKRGMDYLYQNGVFGKFKK
ncbi:MAG: hypothetical protein CBC10_004770 [Gammaproteobacteria bacterium TMED50]|nr:MAG: hypothetical protein CBC10_004770 [Gammaproteobacteria bacterium TMED50]